MHRRTRLTAADADEQQEQPEIWLTQCKDSTLHSPEWRQLVKEVFAETKGELSKRHIVFFSDLTHDEKAALISEVEKRLQGTAVLDKLLALVRRSVDLGLSAAVTQEIAAGEHPLGDTKIDVLMKKASKTASQLLSGWPRNEQHLRLMLNRELSGPLRAPAWGVLLARKDARGQYDKTVARHPSSTISDKDTDILQKCQRLLVSDFGSVASSSRLVVTVMKTVISYCHVISGNAGFLDYESNLLKLLVPLLSVFSHECAKGSAGTLIEHYIGMVAIVQPAVFPEYPAPTVAPPHHQMMAIIHKRDPQLLAALKGVPVRSIEPAEQRSGEWFDGNSQTPEPAAAVGVRDSGLCEQMNRVMERVRDNMFILSSTATCVTKMELVYFVYDQCLLSRFALLPVLCAAVVTLARGQLMEAESIEMIELALYNVLGALTVPALQRELQTRYSAELAEVGMPQWVGELAESIEGSPLLFHEDLNPPVQQPVVQQPIVPPLEPTADLPQLPEQPKAKLKGKRGTGLQKVLPTAAAAGEAAAAEGAAAEDLQVEQIPIKVDGAGLLLNRMLNFKHALQLGTGELDQQIHAAADGSRAVQPAEANTAGAQAAAAESGVNSGGAVE